MNGDTRSTSFHEAGHAMVAIWFLEEFEIVTIVPNDDYAGCVHRVWTQQHTELLEENFEPLQEPFLMKNIMILLAGEYAQTRFDPSSVSDDQLEGDRMAIHHFLDQLANPMDEELRHAWEHLLRIKTRRLVDGLWPQIEQIAHALEERKTLTHQEVTEILRNI
jgi:ATP-dependent Zn protease